MRSYNPTVQAPWFGLFRFRSPLLSESRLISLPPGTEMVHFPGLTRTRLCIQRAVYRVHRYGFPHSEIPGSKPACGSPRLIAASHVLLRLLAPRHPPYALSSLTIKLTQHVPILSDWDTEGYPHDGSCGPSRNTPQTARVDKFAFPLALLELNLRIIAHTNLRSRAQWPASFSCQRALTSHPARLAEANFSGSALGTGFCSLSNEQGAIPG